MADKPKSQRSSGPAEAPSAKAMTPRAERIEINREFSSIDQFINEYVTNVSRSGAFVRSQDPLPRGTRVSLKFTVLLDEVEAIEGVGEVVRVSEKPKGIGVVFVELTGYSQELLAKLMTRRLRK